MTVVKSIVTLINLAILIGLGDAISRNENKVTRIGQWIFFVIYAVTTGLMWW